MSEQRPIYTPHKGANGWMFRQIAPKELPPAPPGFTTYGQEYAFATCFGHVTVKDAETALLILTLLNEGVICGTYKRSNKDINAEAKEAKHTQD